MFYANYNQQSLAVVERRDLLWEGKCCSLPNQNRLHRITSSCLFRLQQQNQCSNMRDRNCFNSTWNLHKQSVDQKEVKRKKKIKWTSHRVRLCRLLSCLLFFSESILYSHTHIARQFQSGSLTRLANQRIEISLALTKLNLTKQSIGSKSIILKEL